MINLTEVKRKVALILSVYTGSVRDSSGHLLCMVHKVFWHIQLVLCCSTRIVTSLVLCKVVAIITVKCHICFVWIWEQNL